MQRLAGKKHFFHWELDFPEIFYEKGAPKENPGWDVVVGNPPWIGHVTSDLEPVLGGNVFGLKDKVDTFLSFIDKAIVLTKLNGWTSFITPNTYFNNRIALPLRRELAISRQLALIIDLPKRTFLDAPDVYPCISIFSKRNEMKENYLVGKGFNFNIEPLLISVPYEHVKPPNYYIQVSRPNTHAEILFSRLESVCPMLRDYATFRKGVETGDDSKYLRCLNKPEIGRHHWLHGREIERFGINSSGCYVNYGQHLKNPQTLDLLTTPKIMIQYIRKLTLYPRIVAAFDNGEFFPSYGTVVSLVSNGLVHWGFLLVLLNSNLLNRFYQYRFHDIAVKGEYIYRVPIRRISFTTPPARRAALFEEVKALYSAEAPDSQNILDFVAMRLDARPEESDVVHDLLAYLAERMIEMKKEKNAEIKSFLDFLKGEIGASIDDFSNKTAIQEYYSSDHEFQTLIEVLVKNKKKLKAGYDPQKPCEL